VGTDIEADVMVRPDQRRGHGVQTVDLQAYVGTRRGPRAGLVTLARGRRHHRPLHVQLGLLLATVCAALGVGLLVGAGIQIGHVQSHVCPNLPLPNDTFALARPQMADSLGAQQAVSIFLRVPASGARGLAASQSPAVRFRIRGSSLV